MQPISSYLAVANVTASMEFLERAFGFSRGVVLADVDGQLRYGEMRHGDAVVVLIRKGDTATATRGAAALYTYVADVDKALSQARRAGAGAEEAEDTPWGDRVATVMDPDGYRWVLATFKKLAPSPDHRVSATKHLTNEFAVARLVHRDDAVGTELLPHALTGGLRDALVPRSIGEQADGALGHLVHGVRRVQEAADPVLDDLRQSPTREATTGTSHAIASSAASPKLSCEEGSRKRSLTESNGTTSSCAPTILDQIGDAEFSSDTIRRPKLRSVADEQEPGANSPANPVEDREHVLNALDRSKVRYVRHDLHAGVVTAEAFPQLRRRLAAMQAAIQKIRDDGDVAGYAKLFACGRPEAFRHGGDAIRLFDGERDDLGIRGVAANQRDVGTVERCDDARRSAARPEHLP